MSAALPNLSTFPYGRVPLCQAVYFQEGPGIRDWEFTGCGVPIMNIRLMRPDGTLDTSGARCVSADAAYSRWKHFLLDSDDIVLASSGSLGKRAWVKKRDLPLLLNTSVIRFRPLNSALLDRHYLWHYLGSDDFQRQFARLKTGTAQFNFGPSHLKQMTMILPSISEQKRIAAILDKADAIRRKRQQAIQFVNEFLRSLFLHLFGDPVRNSKAFPVSSLEELVRLDRPITYGILKPGPDVPNGIPYVRVLDLKAGSVLCSQLRRTTVQIADAYRRSTLQQGDLLLSIRGQVGRVALVPPEANGANITQDTARLAFRDVVLGSYMFGCITSTGLQREMQRHVKGGAVQGINLRDVKDLRIPVPPLALQQKFDGIFRRTLDLQTLVSRQFEKVEHGSNSLRQRAFSQL